MPSTSHTARFHRVQSQRSVWFLAASSLRKRKGFWAFVRSFIRIRVPSLSLSRRLCWFIWVLYVHGVRLHTAAMQGRASRAIQRVALQTADGNMFIVSVGRCISLP